MTIFIFFSTAAWAWIISSDFNSFFQWLVILFALPSSIGFTIIRIGGALLLLAGAAITFLAWKNRDIIADDAIVRDE